MWDQAGRFTVRLDPPVFFEWTLNLPRAEPWFRGWLDTRAVVLPGEEDRVRDTVARIADMDQNETPWAVVVEIQSSTDAEMLGRMNEYEGLLYREEKPDQESGSRYRVGGLVLNLVGRQNEIPQEQLSRTLVKSLQSPAVLNLIEQDADATLGKIETDELGLAVLPWVPLTQGGGREDIIDRWKALGMKEPDRLRRAHYGALALLFAEKAGCLDPWKKAMEGWNVEESVVVNEWIKQGEEKGEKKGEQIGLKKGIAETLAVALQLKFGEEGLAFADELAKTQKLETLRLVQQSLLDVQTLDELRGLIAAQQ